MISGMDIKEQTNFDKAFKWMESHRFITFHLTGSRAFGYHREDSDWDFFCDDILESEDYAMLRQLGFGKTTHEDYSFEFTGDPSILELYRFTDSFNRIDIQVINSKALERKIAANNFLKENQILTATMSKATRTTLYRELMRTLACNKS